MLISNFYKQLKNKSNQ